MGRRPKSGRVCPKLCHRTAVTYRESRRCEHNPVYNLSPGHLGHAQRSAGRIIAGAGQLAHPSGRRSNMSPRAVCPDSVNCHQTKSAPAPGVMKTMRSPGPAVRLCWQGLTLQDPLCPFAIPNPAKRREFDVTLALALPSATGDNSRESRPGWPLTGVVEEASNVAARKSDTFMARPRQGWGVKNGRF